MVESEIINLRIWASHCPYLMVIRALANIIIFIFKISWRGRQHPSTRLKICLCLLRNYTGDVSKIPSDLPLRLELQTAFRIILDYIMRPIV